MSHNLIDKEQPKEKACWFPFAPPTGNVMYCLPQIGTYASLYFPDASGNNAQVLGCVRKNGDSCAKTADPNIRYWGTEHGNELELSPIAINIVAGCKEPLKLSFDDATGVTMTSHKKIVLNAAGDISFKTPKRIIISAPNQIVVKKTKVQSGFAMENEFHFLGTEVQLNGWDRTTYPPFDDEPKVGKPIIQPPVSAKITPEAGKSEGSGFSWGNLFKCVVAAVAAVAAVVVKAFTSGAGALVGAALGAIGGVASTAASDATNSKASSPSECIENALKNDLRAVCGAIFGPLESAVSIEDLKNEILKGSREFYNGVLAGFDNSFEFGICQAVTGKRLQSDSIAFEAGKVTGDVGAMIVGSLIDAGGGAEEVGGLTLDATGAGAIIGAPLNVAGAATIALGSTVIANSGHNFVQDAQDLMMSASKGPGTKGGSKAEKHHIATDKSKKFDFKNHPAFKDTDIDISKDIDNLVDLANHRGRHTNKYHQEIQDRLDAVYERYGGTDKLEEAVRNELKKMKQELLDGNLDPYKK